MGVNGVEEETEYMGWEQFRILRGDDVALAIAQAGSIPMRIAADCVGTTVERTLRVLF